MVNSRVSLSALVACALCLIAARAADAHHVMSEYGIAPILPRRVFEVDVQAGATRNPGGDVAWQLVAPTLEWSAAERVSIWGRLPLAHVRYPDGRAESGLCDAPTSARRRPCLPRLTAVSP